MQAFSFHEDTRIVFLTKFGKGILATGDKTPIRIRIPVDRARIRAKKLNPRVKIRQKI